MKVLGIDPGTSRIGYGFINEEGGILSHLASGIILTPRTSQAEKLEIIEKELAKLIAEGKPQWIGVEKLFFFKNQKTALEVAEARGIIMVTIKKSGVPFSELTPLEVKVAMTGDGRAPKNAVAKMVGLFLKMPPKKVFDDVTDALAIAIAASRKAKLGELERGQPC